MEKSLFPFSYDLNGIKTKNDLLKGEISDSFNRLWVDFTYYTSCIKFLNVWCRIDRWGTSGRDTGSPILLRDLEPLVYVIKPEKKMLKNKETLGKLGYLMGGGTHN